MNLVLRNPLQVDNSKIQTAYLLAGGKSSRMGSDKGLLLFRNKPMAKHILEVLQNVFPTVKIVSNSPLYTQFGLEVIPDLVPDSGPMGGIYTGLLDCKEDAAFFVGCDMPFITEQAIHYLLVQAQDSCSVASSGDKIHPLFGTYLSRESTVIKEHLDSGKFKMLRLIDQLSAKIISYEQHEWPDIFVNINSPEDLNHFNH
jgi:molybdenum cofactor guanylyltransferase